LDDRKAGLALLSWLDRHLPAADAAELAMLLRSFRRQGLRRRGDARRAFRAAFVARVPAGERAEAEAAIAWLFGERWLPPAEEEVLKIRAEERGFL
jgi:hypothetical protein